MQRGKGMPAANIGALFMRADPPLKVQWVVFV